MGVESCGYAKLHSILIMYIYIPSFEILHHWLSATTDNYRKKYITSRNNDYNTVHANIPATQITIIYINLRLRSLQL